MWPIRSVPSVGEVQGVSLGRHSSRNTTTKSWTDTAQPNARYVQQVINFTRRQNADDGWKNFGTTWTPRHTSK